MEKEQKTIAIFDFDIIAYRCSAAVEERTIEVLHKSSGKIKTFKTRTEFKNFLKKKSYPYVEDSYTITDVQTPEPERNAFALVKRQVASISEQIWADDLVGYVGSDLNFRLNLDLPVEYKGSRKTQLRPKLLKQTKRYILSKYDAEMPDNDLEADDYVVIRYFELKAKGYDPIIITIDKDVWGCVGVTFYDWTKDKPEIKTVPVLGYLDYDYKKKKMHGLGLKFYAYQMLHGDASDDYTPRDLHGKKFGDTKILELLKDLKTVDDVFVAVLDKYKEWFPEPLTYNNWKGEEVTKSYHNILEMYHSCVYMKRSVNDTTGFFDLWKEFKGKEEVV